MGKTHEYIEQKNFALNALEGALFIASGALISSQTVLPALVSRLGGGSVAVGGVSVLVWFGLFLPQIFAARYVETLPWKKPWAVWMGLSHRIVLFINGLVILLLATSYPALALWLVLALIFAMNVLMGVTTPGWFDLFAKVTPTRRRGRLVGIRNSIGGGAAFLCGLLLTWLLGSFHFPLSYATAFFCAWSLQMLSLIVQTQVVEEGPSNVVGRKPVLAYLHDMPDIFRRNKEFRNFIITSAVLTVAAMPVGFYTVYALKSFSGDESVVGEFTLTMVAIQVVSALVNGYIADHYGNKAALVCAASGLFFASVVALIAPTLGWFRLVYIFLGVNLGTELMARYNISIEFCPTEQRSTYVGLMNTVLAPCYGSGLLGGWLIDSYGYHSVFGVGAVCSFVGIILLVFLVRDPRFIRAVRGSTGLSMEAELQPD
jgi:MFS family permease